MSEESTTDPMAEVKAMALVAEAVSGLDAEATARIVRWMADRYKVGLSFGGGKDRAESGRSGSAAPSGGGNGNGSRDDHQFADLAELYNATAPESDADKTLVAAYWAQYGEGKAEFGSQELNTALKNLGHAIGNITTAFDTLKARKPAPVMQLKKSGSSKQARKTFRLTLAGKSAVEAMIGQQ